MPWRLNQHVSNTLRLLVQAMLMTNCQLAVLGDVTFACRPDMTLKQCNEGMSSRAFELFGNIFANVDRCTPWNCSLHHLRGSHPSA